MIEIKNISQVFDNGVRKKQSTEIVELNYS